MTQDRSADLSLLLTRRNQSWGKIYMGLWAMRRQNFILWIIVVIAIVGISMASLVFYKWNAPLGPSLGLPTYTPGGALTPVIPAVEGTPIPSAAITTPQPSNLTGLGTPQPSPTATKPPLCGGPRTMTILAIGSDARDTGYKYGLADSIHVMRIDFSIPNIMVVDFPRDLWVEIPGIADHHGITHGKLNQAYLYGNPGMGYYDGPGEGPGLLARTLDLNFGLRVDHYLAIDAQTFVRIIDAVGGVDVKVESSINLNNYENTPDPSLYLSVGTHHLDGETAYLLATNRVPSTFQRMKYQKIILTALREKLLSPEILPKIPQLVTRFISSVQTDLSPREINSLICIAQAVPTENIKADSFPQEMFKPDHIYGANREATTFIYTVDFAQLRALVAQFMNGIWPMP